MVCGGKQNFIPSPAIRKLSAHIRVWSHRVLNSSAGTRRRPVFAARARHIQSGRSSAFVLRLHLTLRRRRVTVSPSVAVPQQTRSFDVNSPGTHDFESGLLNDKSSINWPRSNGLKRCHPASRIFETLIIACPHVLRIWNTFELLIEFSILPPRG